MAAIVFPRTKGRVEVVAAAIPSAERIDPFESFRVAGSAVGIGEDSQATHAGRRARVVSREGGQPNWRLYSRLNCDGLS